MQQETTPQGMYEEYRDTGSKEAIGALVAMLGGLVWSIAFGILRDRGDAENVAQDAWISLLKCRDKIRDIQAWMAKVTKNAALSVLNKKKPKILPPEDIERSTTDGKEISEIDANFDYQMLRTKLESADQHLLDLKVKDAMSYKEIAELTDQSKTAVSREFKRIRETLE